MFIALRSVIGYTHIDMQMMHGRGYHHHVVETGIGHGAIQFAVDRDLEEIFWTDYAANKISFTNFEGNMYHTFLSDVTKPVSIAILGDDIFWTIENSMKVYWTPKHNLEATKKIQITPPPYISNSTKIIALATSPSINVEHICQIKNGKCSHICVPLSKTTAACLCPPGMVFSDSRNITCIEAIDCEFRCGSGECITISRKCNGRNDCADGSDEKYCKIRPDAETICSDEQFKCANGHQCIDKKLYCDMNYDCDDNSDEKDCKNYNATMMCHDKQYACPGTKRCIDRNNVCDGYLDCDDGADESNCPVNSKSSSKLGTCQTGTFQCTTGQCIPLTWVCDESVDCSDGSDEHNCRKY